MGEFQSARELMDLWAAKLPERRMGPDGEELVSSRLRRAVFAYELQQQEEARDPQLRVDRERARKAADAEERARRSSEMEARYWIERPQALERMGLERQETVALAALEDRPSIQAAKRWWHAGRAFLALGGEPGSGKTITAAMLLELAATERIECESISGPLWNAALGRFVKAQELARMSLFGKETEKRLDRLRLVGLLVIDDLGAESKYDGWTSMFDELVDARARHQVRTVITTNLTSAELANRYGQRVFRRLKDFGEFVATTQQTRGTEGAKCTNGMNPLAQP